MVGRGVKGRLVLLAGALVLTCLVSPVSAVPIGAFSWDEDPFFGPFFTVDNFSGVDFIGVVVALHTGTVSSTLLLGDLATNTSIQSTEDLTGLQITSATLSFSSTLPGVIVYPALSAPFTAAVIDYHPPAPPVSVPEPATWMFVAMGLVGIAAVSGVRTALARSGLISGSPDGS